MIGERTPSVNVNAPSCHLGLACLCLGPPLCHECAGQWICRVSLSDALLGVEMQISPLEWNNILTTYRAGFATPEYKNYHGMFDSVGYTAPPFDDRYTEYRIWPTGCCNLTGYK